MCKKTFITFFIIVLFGFYFFISFHANANRILEEQGIYTLESMRNKLTFKEYSLEQKQNLLNQVLLVLKDLYVNRYTKISYYGNTVDPLPKVNQIKNNLKNMSTKELHIQLAKIFAEQRDLHLNYILPNPYNNCISFIPLMFEEVYSSESPHKIVISSINGYFFDNIMNIKCPDIGDEILEYNGKPIVEAIEQIFPHLYGAGNAAGYTHALNYMTMIPHSIYPLPEENNVKIKLKKIDGSIYNLEIPWFLYQNEQKKNSGNKPKNLTNYEECFEMSYNNSQIIKMELDKMLGFNATIPFNLNSTDEPVLSWGIISNKYGKFGYLKLSSFKPVNGNNQTINEIISLCKNQFKDTLGLVFDIRGNPGGSITLAEKIPQLFSSKEVSVNGFRLLNSDLNRKIFNESALGEEYPEWKEAINKINGTDKRYTEPLSITSKNEANSIGRVYFGPVAVFTDASSYSASDVFACMMQDNNIAEIWGEDAKTGAGGANIVQSAKFLELVKEPFQDIMDVSIGFSWRQCIRSGKNQGFLIEDLGCVSDRRVQKTVQDILDGGKSQYDRITRDLAIKAKEN